MFGIALRGRTLYFVLNACCGLVSITPEGNESFSACRRKQSSILMTLQAFMMYGYDAGVLGGVQATEPFLAAMGVRLPLPLKSCSLRGLIFCVLLASDGDIHHSHDCLFLHARGDRFLYGRDAYRHAAWSAWLCPHRPRSCDSWRESTGICLVGGSDHRGARPLREYMAIHSPNPHVLLLTVRYRGLESGYGPGVLEMTSALTWNFQFISCTVPTYIVGGTPILIFHKPFANKKVRTDRDEFAGCGKGPRSGDSDLHDYHWDSIRILGGLWNDPYQQSILLGRKARKPPPSIFSSMLTPELTRGFPSAFNWYLP
jgi:hypothetical protein